MFSIHPGLRGYLMSIPLFVLHGFFILLGLFFVGSTLTTARAIGDYFPLLLIGGLLAVMPGVLIFSMIYWLRKVSDVIRHTQPTSVVLSIRIEEEATSRGGPRIVYRVWMRPLDGTVASFAPIEHVRVYLGKSSTLTNMPDYTDYPTQAYIPRNPGEPLVFLADGRYCFTARFPFK